MISVATVQTRQELAEVCRGDIAANINRRSDVAVGRSFAPFEPDGGWKATRTRAAVHRNIGISDIGDIQGGDSTLIHQQIIDVELAGSEREDAHLVDETREQRRRR